MNLLDLFFPPRCLSCRRFFRQPLCPACEDLWPALHPPFCNRCSIPFHSPATDFHLCGDCLERDSPCRRIQAAGLYEGVLHDLIIRMKYRNEERLASYLGGRMAEGVSGNGWDLVVPIPLHKKRLRERGFNQALLLSRPVAKALRLEVDPFVMVKQRETPPQAVLKGEERRRNLKGAFEVRVPEKIRDKKILVVDDVCTTGATIEEAAGTLLKAGAKEVEAYVLARAV